MTFVVLAPIGIADVGCALCAMHQACQCFVLKRNGAIPVVWASERLGKGRVSVCRTNLVHALMWLPSIEQLVAVSPRVGFFNQPTE